MIKDSYEPTSERHGSFIAGGRSREALSRDVHTGDLNSVEVHNVLSEIRRWALRGERWRDEMDQPVESDKGTGEGVSETCQAEAQQYADMDVANTPSNLVPRPKGCAEYEALEVPDRNQVRTNPT